MPTDPALAEHKHPACPLLSGLARASRRLLLSRDPIALVIEPVLRRDDPGVDLDKPRQRVIAMIFRVGQLGARARCRQCQYRPPANWPGAAELFPYRPLGIAQFRAPSIGTATLRGIYADATAAARAWR